MILNDFQLQGLTTEDVKNHKHLVFNTEKTMYRADRCRMIAGINILAYIAQMIKLNDVFKALKINKHINVSILYDAVGLVMSGKALNQKQTELFLETQRINDEFENQLSNFVEIFNYLPTDTELLLFGFTSYGVIKSKHDCYENFVDDIFELKADVLKGNISVEDFINKSKQMYAELPREKKLKISA